MKKSVVLGLGVSGKAAMEWLYRRGAHVVGYDARALECQDARWSVYPDTDPVDWTDVEQLVVSPGISPQHPLYRAAVEKGIPIVGEAGLGLPQLSGFCIGVTGTNGKTTVTKLIEHVLNAQGISAIALGNVGASICEYLNRGERGHQVFVIELSSFQLETLALPVLDEGVILNITPDHLDRHGTMQEYAAAKCQMQRCLKPGAPLFVSEEVVRDWGPLLQLENLSSLKSDESLLPLSYRAKHEVENLLAAWSLCQPFSISMREFIAALETFRAPPHRIEFIRCVRGVAYYDDSKGTNLDAVVQAIRAMPGPVILIAGGVDKGASYAVWKACSKVKCIITIGQAAPKIRAELSSCFEMKQADSLSCAVEIASALGEEGDCVLLSPGCSSYDQFTDYAHRGRVFQECVYSLGGKL